MNAPVATDATTRQALLRRWQSRDVPLIVFVTHAHGGGIQRHVDDLAAAIGPRALVLCLVPGDDGRLVLHAANDANAMVHAAPERMLAILQAIGVDRLHIHTLHGFEPEILSLPRELGVPYDVTLHDSSALCPAYHMVDGSGHYCGGQPSCHRCDEARESPWPLGIDEWRAAFAALLRGADRVIAPSDDCARRHRLHLPDLAVNAWPHPRPQRAVPEPVVRVLVPGAISPKKGLELVAACLDDARRRALPIHFRVLGFLVQPLPTWPDAPLSVSGEYGEGGLPDLLAREPGDVVLFAAQCPETYSYTLADALDTGMPIVATDLGAFPERLRSTPHARIVAHDIDAASLNDTLLAAAGRRPASTIVAGDEEAYAQRYLAPVRRRSVQAAPIPALTPAESQPPQRRPHGAPLAWLYEDGVEAGKASSRQRLKAALPAMEEELARRRAEADALRDEVGQVRAALEEARRASQQATDALQAARGDAAALRSSTSWRLTRPLRALARLLGRGAG